CLHKEPYKRYASAGELADDLGRFLAGEPILARPTPAWERAVKWARRRPTAAAALAIAVSAALSLLGLGLWYHAQLQAAFSDSEKHRLTAEKALDESKQRLVRLHIDRGIAFMNQGDLLDSLVFMSEAMRLDPQGGPGEEAQRIRVGAILRQCPPLLERWVHQSSVNHAEF